MHGCEGQDKKLRMQTEARWLHPLDDVATALRGLRADDTVLVASGGLAREIRLTGDIPAGHKFAVRSLGAGLRIRKYGEFIGRLTQDVEEGAHVHLHNLETCARKKVTEGADWLDRIEPTPAFEVLGESRTFVGESPLWDETTGRFYWIDVRDRPRIFMLEANASRETVWPMAEDVGTVVLGEGGKLLAALRSGFAWFDPADGSLDPILDPEADLPGNRMNDGKCDAAGRFWCGSMNPETGLAEGNFYRLDADLSAQRLFGGLFTPNGPSWSPDGRTFYLADTRQGTIFAFDCDPQTGQLGERRVFADLGALPGGPDGAAIDAEGCLWSAQFGGGCLIRYAPDGAIDRVIRMPVGKPASVAFGGEGYRRLFVTTASRGMTEAQLTAEPLAGRVLVMDVGVAGLPPARFRANRGSAMAGSAAGREVA